MNTASWGGAAALVWATVVTTWFLIVYSSRGPWWRPEPGDPHGEIRANLGYVMLSLDLLFVVYDVRPLFNPGVFAWIRTGLFWVLAIMLTWRLVLLLRRGHSLPR